MSLPIGLLKDLFLDLVWYLWAWATELPDSVIGWVWLLLPDQVTDSAAAAWLSSGISIADYWFPIQVALDVSAAVFQFRVGLATAKILWRFVPIFGG